jgi:RNA polymerase sigma-70 factor (ECF subfamily)
MALAMTGPALSARDTEVVAAGSERDDAVSADRLLARRAAAGDMHAFGQLVTRYQRPMAALVSRLAPNPDDVDDIVQELFLRAWKGLPRFRHDAQFSTWLYRIAVNTAIKYRSRVRQNAALSVSAEDLAGGLEQLASPEDAPAELGGDPQRQVERRERDALLHAAVRLLPEKQRTVLVLHYFEGKSCEEIGQIVGCSVGTVWSRLHYACKRLKGQLGDL